MSARWVPRHRVGDSPSALAQIDHLRRAGRPKPAIATGGDLRAFVTALQEGEQRGGRLRNELAALERGTGRVEFDLHRVLGDSPERLIDWYGLLR